MYVDVVHRSRSDVYRRTVMYVDVRRHTAAHIDVRENTPTYVDVCQQFAFNENSRCDRSVGRSASSSSCECIDRLVGRSVGHYIDRVGQSVGRLVDFFVDEVIELRMTKFPR